MLLGISAEGATYALYLHGNRIIIADIRDVSAQKVGMEDAQRNNNALRGHMMAVPVYGLCHCSPERRFCPSSPKRINNVGHCLPPLPFTLYKYPPSGPNVLSIHFRVPPPRHPSRFYSVSP